MGPKWGEGRAATRAGVNQEHLHQVKHFMIKIFWILVLTKINLCLQRIDAASKFTYRRILVPDDMAANVVYMNGTVLCKSEKESPDSFRFV